MSKIKFIPRAKRKALEAKLATLEVSSDEAKAIRGQLGWGEPAPPAPKPVVKEVPRAPAPKKPAARKPINSVIRKPTKPKTT